MMNGVDNNKVMFTGYFEPDNSGVSRLYNRSIKNSRICGHVSLHTEWKSRPTRWDIPSCVLQWSRHIVGLLGLYRPWAAEQVCTVCLTINPCTRDLCASCDTNNAVFELIQSLRIM